MIMYTITYLVDIKAEFRDDDSTHIITSKTHLSRDEIEDELSSITDGGYHADYCRMTYSIIKLTTE